MRQLKRAYQKNAKHRMNFKQKAITAGTIAAITLGASSSLQKVYANPTTSPDKHQKVFDQDSDKDMLSDSEEFALGYVPFKSDQNKNGISDGVELAKKLEDIIDSLPSYAPGGSKPIPEEIYKISHLTRGFEKCDICGEYINMGGREIVNPKLNLTFPDPNDPLESEFLPELAIHYMEHGSFDCNGEVHSGRVDIPHLLRVLEVRFPYEPNDHQLALEDIDTDSDLLTDSEELSSGLNFYDIDQNKNLIPDGIDLAQECAREISSLPEADANDNQHIYKENFMMKGLEYCDTCGLSVNMGYWLVTNSKLDLSIEVPEIILHYMEHGSFSFAGDVHGNGRIDVALLKKILEMPQQCGDLGTIFSPSDVNQDCKIDINDMNSFVEMWLNEINP